MKLEFQFPDLQSFLWMNGHGGYVWSCYLITFLVLATLIIQPVLARKRFLRQQRSLANRTADRQTLNSEE